MLCRRLQHLRAVAGGGAAGDGIGDAVSGRKLKLRVNRDKSAVAPVGERKFLGHRLVLNGKLGISPKSVNRAKEKVRQITSRTRGVNLVRVIVELNAFLVGWLLYYRYAACRGELIRLDEWIRRKLRCYRLKQRKRSTSIAGFLRRMGVPAGSASRLASSGKRGRGVWPIVRSSIKPCRPGGSTPRVCYPWSPNMTSYDIK